MFCLTCIYSSFKYNEDVIIHNLFTGLSLVSFISVFILLNKSQENESIK